MRNAIIMGLALAMLPAIVPAQTTTHTLTHGGTPRAYRVYVPPSYTPGTPAALVFNLHGYGSNAQQQELYSGMNAVADTAGFILCYPDGLNNSWNSGWTLPYSGGVDDVGFISRLIDTLSAWHTIDPAQVYSCGMSNGGFMSFRLACDLEQRIAAIASVTGTMSSIQLQNCQPSRPVAIMQVHGTLDGTVPYNGQTGMASVASTLSYWRTHNNCPATASTYNWPDLVLEGSTATSTDYSPCDDATEVLHIQCANGGHTWPGAFPVASLGITNQDFSASVEIWRFFLRHRHPSVATGSASPDASPLRAYPNPSAGQWRITGIAPGAQVQVYDLRGRIVMSAQSSHSDLTVDGRGWPAGVYWLRVGEKGMRLVKA